MSAPQGRLVCEQGFWDEGPSLRRDAVEFTTPTQCKPGESVSNNFTCPAASLINALLFRLHDGGDREGVLLAIDNLLVSLASAREDEAIAKGEAFRAKVLAGVCLTQQDFFDATDALYVLRGAASTGAGEFRSALGFSAAGQDSISAPNLVSLLFNSYLGDPKGSLSADRVGRLSDWLLQIGCSRAEVEQTFAGRSGWAELPEGECLQVGAVVQGAFNPHALLVGRFASGDYFLADQGKSPGWGLAAPQWSLLFALNERIGRYASDPETGYWPRLRDSSCTLFRLDYARVAEAAKTLPEGKYLAQADPSYLPFDSVDVRSGPWLERHWDLAEAQAAAEAQARGRSVAIVEHPRGAFSLYEASGVSDACVSAASFDWSATESNSYLYARSRHGFERVWLVLGSATQASAALPIYPRP